ncbi:MAG: hypothetical protein WC501_02830 [Candidatus Micrarchaeia archaeon]
MPCSLICLIAGTSSTNSKISSEILEKILYLYFVERLNIRRIAKELNLSHMSIYRALNRCHYDF